jgi:hypothetical protein
LAGGIGVLRAEGSVDLSRIEADDHGSIDDGNRGCHVSEPLKLCNSFGVLGHIALSKRDLLLRKILFRPLAEHSTGLCEYRYGFLHLPFLEPLPDASRPQFGFIRSASSAAGSQLSVNDNGRHRADAKGASSLRNFLVGHIQHSHLAGWATDTLHQFHGLVAYGATGAKNLNFP